MGPFCGITSRALSAGALAKTMPQNARVPALRALNRIMIERNLSPGGSADMLALAYLIDAWRTLTEVIV